MRIDEAHAASLCAEHKDGWQCRPSSLWRWELLRRVLRVELATDKKHYRRGTEKQTEYVVWELSPRILASHCLFAVMFPCGVVLISEFRMHHNPGILPLK